MRPVKPPSFTFRRSDREGSFEPLLIGKHERRFTGIDQKIISMYARGIDRTLSPHMQLRKIIKNRGHFPSDEAATKLLWLALLNVLRKAVRSTKEWKSAMTQFAILYGD